MNFGILIKDFGVNYKPSPSINLLAFACIM